MLFILSVDNQMRYAQAQLDKLKKTNVFNSTFHIWWVDSLIILWAFMFQNHDCYSHSQYAFKPHQKYFLLLMINEENLKCGESNK